MVFMHGERNYKYAPQFKCINCNRTITDPHGGLDARRYCSTKCREEYLGK